MSPQEAMDDALAMHPDCEYADWVNGMGAWFNLTIVVRLWRNSECADAGDPPKYTVQGYQP